MNAQEFDSLMSRVESAYGQKVSADARLFIWPLCEKIPARFLNPIADRLTDLDERPRNLKRAIRTIWQTLDSSAANADDRKGCPECTGGTIYATREGKTFACQCATCHPAGEHKATQAQLRQAGYTIDNPARSGRIASPEQARMWLERIHASLGMAVSLASADKAPAHPDPREAARRAELADSRRAA